MLAAPWFLAVVAFVVNAVSTFLMLQPEIEKAKQTAVVTKEEKVIEEKKVEEERVVDHEDARARVDAERAAHVSRQDRV